MIIFKGRYAAGEQLADLLVKYKKQSNTIVLGLPRGGVVTAFSLAKKLQLPLNVICPRKIRAPQNPELALGAVTETGIAFYNWPLIRQLGVTEQELNKEIEEQRLSAQQRSLLFRRELPPLVVKDKTIIIVDDGLATGATMRAAIQELKQLNAMKIVVAVPVSPPDTLQEINGIVDEVYCIETPEFFQAVGQFYEHFDQVSDDEVLDLLESQHTQSN